jgi:hypothetical protein
MNALLRDHSADSNPNRFPGLNRFSLATSSRVTDADVLSNDSDWLVGCQQIGRPGPGGKRDFGILKDSSRLIVKGPAAGQAQITLEYTHVLPDICHLLGMAVGAHHLFRPASPAQTLGAQSFQVSAARHVLSLKQRHGNLSVCNRVNRQQGSLYQLALVYSK